MAVSPGLECPVSDIRNLIVFMKSIIAEI